ncbi:hypothetical protein ACFY9N_11560 [Microbacterium sp. NPDC008134]|uniref:hypothetical protein n=1 Tax=Microbacterium sp. NPDC008134 TaxID=3364183 RepID=UPI0036E7BC61
MSDTQNKWIVETPTETVKVDGAAIYTENGELHVAEDGGTFASPIVAIFAPGRWDSVTKETGNEASAS